MLTGATPAWFADNVAQIALVTLVVLTVLVARMVHKTMLRFALIGLIAAVGVFVYVNRGQLETCARTCECRIVDRDITVPACGSELEL